MTQVQKVRKLYKTVLKLHRGLPNGLQTLGDNYARDEFKRHKNCTPKEAEIFLNEWTNYAISLAEQLGLRGPVTSHNIGAPLSQARLEQFREEQIHQLYELMLAAQEDKNKDPNR